MRDEDDDTGAANAGAGTFFDDPAGAGIGPEDSAAHDVGEAATRLLALFAGSESAHGTHGEPEQEPGSTKWSIKTTAHTVREAATTEQWAQHLQGKRPLGIVPIRSVGTCTWGCIDIDQYDAEVLRFVAKVEDAKLPLVCVRSKSGGLHLFLFLREPQPADRVIATLKSLAAKLGLPKRCEIFPKQARLEDGSVGNWIAMPYFGDDYGGKLRQQVGVRRTGAELSLEEFLDKAEAARCDLPSPSADAVVETTDMPPCLAHLSRQGVEENRNNALLHFGVYAKLSDPTHWEDRVTEFNRTVMRPALPDDEVKGVIRSLGRKAYGYTCQAQPMAGCCDREECLRSKFGVRAGSRPVIDRIEIVMTDPRQYDVYIDGGRVRASVAELNNFRRFNECCILQVRRSFVPVKEAEWNVLVDGALRTAKEVQPPPDLRPGADFAESLAEFLTNRARGRRREDLCDGKPWEDDETGRHYFRLLDLQKFLKRNDAPSRTRHQLGELIRSMGGDSSVLKVSTKPLHVWFVPSKAVEPRPEFELDRLGELSPRPRDALA